MTGTWVHEAEQPHECDKPLADYQAVGSVWECECGKRWRVIAKTQLEFTWEPAEPRVMPMTAPAGGARRAPRWPWHRKEQA
jgi:hypothetical protein